MLLSMFNVGQFWLGLFPLNVIAIATFFSVHLIATYFILYRIIVQHENDDNSSEKLNHTNVIDSLTNIEDEKHATIKKAVWYIDCDTFVIFLCIDYPGQSLSVIIIEQ